MSDWPVYMLSEDVRIVASRPMPELDPSVEQEVEAIWQAELAARPALFNGRVFSVDTISPALVCGHWSEYRRVIAQLRRPELYHQLGVRLLTVNGVLYGSDGITIGMRETLSIYSAGMWQFPPAGSIEQRAGIGVTGDIRVDLTHQILVELEEELGITATAIGAITPLAIVEHPRSHELDLGIALHTTLSRQQILDAHQDSGNEEYAELRVLDYDRIGEGLDALGDAVLQPSRVFLSCMRQITRDGLSL